MYFVKPLFFEFEPIKIANVSENGALPAELSRSIALYEKLCLIEVLGVELYTEVINSLELLTGSTDFTLKADATQEIKDLINGKTYNFTYTDFNFDFLGCACDSTTTTQRTWQGFIQTDEFLTGTAIGSIKRSFIADYIYYNYLLTNKSISTGAGQQVLSGENSTSVMNVYKRIERYNEFVFAVLGKENQVGLYQFLHDNKDSYPTWKRNCSIQFKEKF